jgi:hypothetical protein
MDSFPFGLHYAKKQLRGFRSTASGDLRNTTGQIEERASYFELATQFVRMTLEPIRQYALSAQGECLARIRSKKVDSSRDNSDKTA